VIETAKAINISSDQRLLLVEPQEFVIDGQDVKEPIGMSGIRLEAKVHIVTGAERGREHHQVRAPLGWKWSSCCSTRWPAARPC
jgi:hypothetical protein